MWVGPILSFFFLRMLPFLNILNSTASSPFRLQCNLQSILYVRTRQEQAQTRRGEEKGRTYKALQKGRRNGNRRGTKVREWKRISRYNSSAKKQRGDERIGEKGGAKKQKEKDGRVEPN